MATATIDPQSRLIYAGSNLIHGYHDDQAELEYNEDAFSDFVGADGEVCRVLNRNETANVNVTLMETSASNDDLLAHHLRDKAFPGTGKFPLLVKDLRGTLLASAAEAWVVKVPNLSMGKEVKPRPWVIRCAKLKIFGTISSVF